MDNDSSKSFQEAVEEFPVDDRRETLSSSLLSTCPFFFFVVKVVGLSSVYIVVGVLCLLGRLRLCVMAEKLAMPYNEVR